MLKTVMLSVLLAASMTSVAKSQEQNSRRPDPIVAGARRSIAFTSTQKLSDEVALNSAETARRFAVRANDEDGQPGWCKRKRFNCVFGAAVLAGTAASFLGSSLAEDPQYHTEYTLFGPVNQCMAHCDDKQYNRSRFGMAGLIIGGGAAFVLTR